MAKSVGLAQLQRLIDAGTQLVDVLPEAEYREAHLPGAISIPLKRLDAQSTKTLDRNGPVVVYCWDSL